MLKIVIEMILIFVSFLARRIPVNKKIKGVFIRSSLLLRKYSFDFDFFCPRIGIYWSAAAFPDLLTRHMLFEGMYQEDVLLALKQFVLPGAVVYDVGAHHGLMTIIASKLAGLQGKVISFEPNPKARIYLNENLKLNQVSGVIVEDAALSSANGDSNFYVQSGDVSWNSTIVKDFSGSGDDVIVVKTMTLDEYVSSSNHKPDVIKIDTEGSEFMILNGARQTLMEYKPVLIMEFNPESARAAGTTISAFVNFLISHQYRLFVLNRNFFGYYRFKDLVPFREDEHAMDGKMVNVVCVPGNDGKFAV